MTSAAPTDAVVHDSSHHDTPEQRDRKELSALVLFIAGDALFVVLEVLAWFYLRALNPNDGWRFSTATPDSPATSGSNNPHDITAIVSQAPRGWAIAVAVATLAVGLIVFAGEAKARRGAAATPLLGFAAAASVVAVVLQVLQFQYLPFQTTDGTYASCVEFFMGSNLAHLLIVVIVTLGVAIRSGRGLYATNWYQIRLVRIWSLWVGISAVILTVVSLVFV
jgi:heme/copper-type cytochrome/quinol oxidase subunit 3